MPKSYDPELKMEIVIRVIKGENVSFYMLFVIESSYLNKKLADCHNNYENLQVYLKLLPKSKLL